MKIADKIIGHMGREADRHNQFLAKFGEFVDGLAFFTDPNTALPDVSIEISLDRKSVKVAYSTVKIEIRFLVSRSATDALLIGQAVCTLLEPVFTQTKPVIGSFTFDRTGVTNIDPLSNGYVVELANQAPEIALQFVQQALAYPQPSLA